MRLLLDQGTSRGATLVLRGRGIDAIHTAELGLSTATDHALLAFALDDDRVVVTLDSDFHAILAATNAIAPSVVRIRIERLRADALAEIVEKVLATCSEDLLAGAVVTVDERTIRVRLLPLAK